MKKLSLVFAACALLLFGCQHIRPGPERTLEGFDPKVVRKPQPLFPNVFITEDGYIVVDQEPIRVGKGDVKHGRVTISWALEAGTPYRFPSKDPPWNNSVDGIVIGPGSNKKEDQPVAVDCGVPVGSKGKLFECSFRPPDKGRTKYKYTVNVMKGSEPLRYPLDPNIEGSY